LLLQGNLASLMGVGRIFPGGGSGEESSFRQLEKRKHLLLGKYHN